MLISCILWSSFLLTPIASLTNNFNQLVGECKNGKYCKAAQNNQGFEKYETANTNKLNIQDILSTIQKNWEAPSAYLKKRGYLTQNVPETTHEAQEKDENMDNKRRFFYFPSPKLETEKTIQKDNFDDHLNVDLEIPHIMSTSIQDENTSKKKPNVIKKLKNKLDSWFQPEKEFASQNNTSTFMGGTNNKISDNGTMNTGPNSDISDILKNMSRADIDYVKTFLRCYKETKSKFRTVLELTTKPNKEYFSSTTKVATTISIANNNRITTKNPEIEKNGNFNSTTRTQSVHSVDSKVSLSNTSTPLPVKMEEDVKLDIEIKSNDTEFDAPCSYPTTSTVSMHESSTEASQFPDDSWSNILKFLAHQHHFVDEVGKLPHKSLNLSKIQEMIDSAHETLAAPAILGDDDNSTDCTPIHLNGIDLELEWTSAHDPLEMAQQSTTLDPFCEDQPQLGNIKMNDVKPKAEANEILTDYLLDAPGSRKALIEPPYSDNFLLADNMDFGNLLQMNSDEDSVDHTVLRKRNTQPEQTDDFGPALIDTGPGFSSDDYLDDYIIQNSRKKKNSDNDDNQNGHVEQNSEFFGHKKKRKHKKRKKKKKKYGKKSYEEFEGTDHADFAADCERLVSPRKEVVVDKATQNDYRTFPELSDIQFRVSADQQESIDKFIKNLNDPPEIFNFDVNQFMKPKSNYKSIQLETIPPKTFYEFLEPPPIENESIPIIAPEPTGYQPLTEQEIPITTEENNSVFNKRDIVQQYIEGDQADPLDSSQHSAIEGSDVNMKRDVLRQYIKGRSQYIRGKPLDAPAVIDTILKPLTAENNDMVENYENRISSNSVNELERPIYYQYGSRIEPPNELGSDEFVDKFYLLNDGSFSIYGADNEIGKSSNKVYKDPVSLDIDLDLEKKFKDLNFVEPMRKKVILNTRDKYSRLTSRNQTV